MRKKLLCNMFLVFAIAVLPFTACSVMAQDNKELIRGTWRLEGELPNKNGKPGMRWFLEWKFSGETFIQTGYPPLRQEGKYRILKNEDSKLTLELYEQSGTFGTKNKQIEIVIDKEKKMLKIDGKEGFTRIEKKKQDG